jgi:cell division protein FtsZ
MSEMGMAMMGSGSHRGENRAREAAEAAIASPLLEDIDLQGARGILVNVTAGLDMSIGEFEEVGNTIKSFASENATVVVGTVIDPEMGDELRVTVVATGLGLPQERVAKPEDNQLRVVPPVRKPAGEIDYRSLEQPSVFRNKPVDEVAALKDGTHNMDYLDIPAFLRRQAD